MTAIGISVIIPAYNEERFLPRLLADIADARARYRPGTESIEVIVADNGSTDGTIDAAESYGGALTARPAPRTEG
ncbi:MAG: glycosyltransferase [Gemmatimonadota bacterium]|nr:glycosyltransferase [Gemmatimonadota bacterium]